MPQRILVVQVEVQVNVDDDELATVRDELASVASAAVEQRLAVRSSLLGIIYSGTRLRRTS